MRTAPPQPVAPGEAPRRTRALQEPPGKLGPAARKRMRETTSEPSLPVRRLGLLVMSLGTMGCAGAAPPLATHHAAPATAGPSEPRPVQSAAPVPVIAPTSASPATSPAVPLDKDPCAFADVDLANVPERCRCFVGQSDGALDLAAEKAPPREACEPGVKSTATSQLRVTGSAAFAKKGAAVPVTFLVENMGSVSAAVRLIRSARGMYPILLSAKDAQGQRHDRPSARCDGPGGSDEATLSNTSSFLSVVLPPGGLARLTAQWVPREAVFLRDLPGKDFAVLRSMSPCRVEFSGRSLDPGRYELRYDVGLAVPPVTVTVELR